MFTDIYSRLRSDKTEPTGDLFYSELLLALSEAKAEFYTASNQRFTDVDPLLGNGSHFLDPCVNRGLIFF